MRYNQFKLLSSGIILLLAILLFNTPQLPNITSEGTPPVVLHKVPTGGIPLPPIKFNNKPTVKKNNKTININYPTIPLSNSLKKYIKLQAKINNIEESLVYSVIWKESRFNPRATNGRGYYGLGQISGKYMNSFAKQVGITNFNPFNPFHNVKVTVHQLAQHKKFWQAKGFEGEKLKIAMLNSYNMGAGAYSKHLSRGGTRQRSYSRQILNYEKHLK